MILARNKFGQIGRQVPGVGLQAKVESPTMGERRGNVYVSPAQVEEDQAYWAQKEREQIARAQAEAFANKFRQKAQELQAQARAKAAAEFQKVAQVDPMNEKLKTFFAKRAMMGEDAKVVNNIALSFPKSADFSASGARPLLVPGEPMTGGNQWSADYRQHLIKGNPLTRDGVYGPGVTDYDRFVNGVDVNQTNVVDTGEDNIAGGTMLGRWDGRMAPRGPHGLKGMGFDWSWDGITSAVSNVANQTVDNVVDKLPDQLAKELQNAVSGGGKVTSSTGGTIVVQRPPTTAPSTVTTMASSMGVPPAVLYGFMGLFAVGVLFIGIKAVKS